MSEKKITTFVGEAQAIEGLTFVFVGKTTECDECKLKPVCIDNLEKGRVYRIVSVKDKVHSCPIHKDRVRLVEVEIAPIDVLIDPNLAYEGAIITFTPLLCHEEECKYYKYCHPPGLNPGEKCRIVKMKKKVQCPIDGTLVKATVIPQF